jgi:hypothetical protein
MADEFDRFLERALAPDERDPDRQFVARVQARIALEQQFAAQRRSLVAEFLRQLAAVAAIAAALWWIARAAPINSPSSGSPALALAVLLTAFGLLVALFSAGSPAAVSRQGRTP